MQARRLAKEYGRTLARIRSLSSFSELLHPQKPESLCNTTTSDPVVVINVHQTRCDALIYSRTRHTSHVPLSGLELSALQDIRRVDAVLRPRSHD